MTWTTRKKYLLGVAIALLVVAALVGAYLLGRSTGEKTTTATTPTSTRTTPTQTTRTQTTSTQAAPGEDTYAPSGPSPGGGAGPEPISPAETTAPVEPAVPLEILSRSAQPPEVYAGMQMHYSVEVQGEAIDVTMSIRGPVNSTVTLYKVATVGDVSTWSVDAPVPAAPGIYHYFASATGADGVTVEMPGTSGWSFLVNEGPPPWL